MANKQKKCSTYAGTTNKWTRSGKVVRQSETEFKSFKSLRQAKRYMRLGSFKSLRQAKRYMRLGS
jgi:hypothetical protein